MLLHLLGWKHYRHSLVIEVLKTMPDPPLLWNLKAILMDGRNVDVPILNISFTDDKVSELFDPWNEKDIIGVVNNNNNVVKNVI